LLRSIGWWLFTDVSGQHIVTIYKVQAVHDEENCLNLKVGPIDCPQTSLNKHKSKDA